MLICNKYRRPWLDAPHNAGHLVRAYDICPSIRQVFTNDVTFEYFRSNFRLKYSQWKHCKPRLKVSLKELLWLYTVLLFISYKFVKGYLAITFLLLLISSWNFHDVCRRFLCTRETKFPHRSPIVKITHFGKVMSMTLPKRVIFTMGVYDNGGLWGNSLSFIGFSWNFVPYYIKNNDTIISWKFQLEIQYTQSGF